MHELLEIAIESELSTSQNAEELWDKVSRINKLAFLKACDIVDTEDFELIENILFSEVDLPDFSLLKAYEDAENEWEKQGNKIKLYKNRERFIYNYKMHLLKEHLKQREIDKYTKEELANIMRAIEYYKVKVNPRCYRKCSKQRLIRHLKGFLI